MFNWFRTPIPERSLKEGTDMEKFTLEEFLFFAHHSLMSIEALLKNERNRKELVNILDQLEQVEQWLEVRHSDYLAAKRKEYSLLEKEELAKSAGGDLTTEQTTNLKKIRQSLDRTEKLIASKFLELTGLALSLRLQATTKFPS